jgi:hypothetical protein
MFEVNIQLLILETLKICLRFRIGVLYYQNRTFKLYDGTYIGQQRFILLEGRNMHCRCAITSQRKKLKPASCLGSGLLILSFLPVEATTE